MTIWMVWYQGLDEAPPLVRRIVRLWKAANPDHEVRVLAQPDVDRILRSERLDPAGLTVQVRANVTRIHLLAEHGGVWADATLLPSRPLSDWLIGKADREGFFAFRKPGWDRMLSNWFLSSEPGHPIATRWREAYVDYFRTPRLPMSQASFFQRVLSSCRKRTNPASFADPRIASHARHYPFFIMHYHFSWLAQTDGDFAGLWRKVPDLPAHPARALRRALRSNPHLPDEEILNYRRLSPVHKLTWRRADAFDRALSLAEAEFAP